MYPIITAMADGTAWQLDVSALTSALTMQAFGDVIEALLPIVAVAVLVGFLFYAVRYTIGLFRGI